MKKHSHKKFQAMIENADWKDYSDRVLKKYFVSRTDMKEHVIYHGTNYIKRKLDIAH